MKQVKKIECVFSFNKFTGNFIIDKSKITDKVLITGHFCLFYYQHAKKFIVD
jgi:hypothetical protein